MLYRATILLALLVLPTVALAQTEAYSAPLRGTSEVPANASAATGFSQAVFDPATNMLSVTGNYNNLSANISGSHIHTGAVGVNGPIIIQLVNTGGMSGTFSATATLTAPQVEALRTQGLYVNIHATGTFPAGEIRGQLARAQTEAYSATLRGANEVPANASTATGASQATFNPATNMLSVTGNYSGLSANISGSHIHTGVAGVNGGIIIQLANTGGMSGTFSASATLTVAQIEALRTQGLYVNIHATGTFPAGEIRAQLVLSSTATSVDAREAAAQGLMLTVRGRQVTFVLRETQPVRAVLFNALGQQVALLFDGEAGRTQTVEVPTGLASGVYIVRVSGRMATATAGVLVLH